MDKKLAAEIDAAIAKAKASGNNWKFTLKEGSASSLTKVIKTRDKADLFMSLLKTGHGK